MTTIQKHLVSGFLRFFTIYHCFDLNLVLTDHFEHMIPKIKRL